MPAQLVAEHEHYNRVNSSDIHCSFACGSYTNAVYYSYSAREQISDDDNNNRSLMLLPTVTYGD